MHVHRSEEAKEGLHGSIEIPPPEVQEEARNDGRKKPTDIHTSHAVRSIGFDTVGRPDRCGTAGPTLCNTIGNAGPAIDEGIGQKQTTGTKHSNVEEQ